MKIKFANAEGAHEREIKGLDILQERLPDHWYGFANYEMILPGKAGRELDLVIVLEDRIMLVDLKDWNGEVTSKGGKWYQNKNDRGPSPVTKLANNARIFQSLFEEQLKANESTCNLRTPWIGYCVVTTGSCKFDLIGEREKLRVKSAKEFCHILRSRTLRGKTFGFTKFDKDNLPTEKSSVMHQAIHHFFDDGTGKFGTQETKFANRAITSQQPIYVHKSGLYKESECKERGRENMEHIRNWNFQDAHVSFAAKDKRSIIAGRDQKAFDYLSNCSSSAEMRLLRPIQCESEKTLRFWEIFQNNPHMTRLSEFIESELQSVEVTRRKLIVKSLVSNLEFLHMHNVKHLDIGYHSVWIENGDSVRFSHFLTSSIDNDNVPSELIGLVTASELLTDQEMSSKALTDYQRDVLATGRLAYHLLTGKKFTSKRSLEQIETELAHCDPTLATYTDWLLESVLADNQRPFFDGGKMREKFDAVATPQEISEIPHEQSSRYMTWGDVSLNSFVSRIYPGDSASSLADVEQGKIYQSTRDSHRYIVMISRNEIRNDERGLELEIFFDTLEYIRSVHSGVLPRLLEFGLVKNYVVSVHEYYEGILLDDFIEQQECTTSNILHLVKSLVSSMEKLHDKGISNGSLTMEDFMIQERDGAPSFLIPSFVTMESRDDFDPKVLDRKIAVEVIKKLVNACDDDGSVTLGQLSDRIEELEGKSPPYLSLESLLSVQDIDDPEVQISEFRIEINGRGEYSSDEFEPDEGVYHLVFEDSSDRDARLIIVGASKALRIFLDDDYKDIGIDPITIKGADYIEMEQGRIGSFERKSFKTLKARITICKTHFDSHSFEELCTHLNQNDIFSRESAGVLVPEDVVDAEEDGTYFDSNDDGYTNSQANAVWSVLTKIEADFHSLFRITSDSEYNRKRDRHLANCDQFKGDFKFEPHDNSVKVERKQPKQRQWKQVGWLDTAAGWSSKDRLAIIAFENEHSQSDQRNSEKQISLFREGDEVRLISRKQDRQREIRLAAANRILAKDSIICDLINRLTPSYYLRTETSDVQANADFIGIEHRLSDSQNGSPIGNQADSLERQQEQGRPYSLSLGAPTAQVSETTIRDMYELNEAQAKAFVRFMTEGPIGLLQGPPGTGKTRFIAAFCHFGITQGHFRSVLIASQAHEAVNNAAEAILKEFGDNIRLVRVGREEKLSAVLRAYGTESLEREYKLRFENEMKAKFRLVAKNLDLPSDFADVICMLTRTVKPMLDKYEKMREESSSESSIHRQRKFLLDRINVTRSRIGIDAGEISPDLGAPEILEDLLDHVARKFGIANSDAVDRMRQVMILSSDWMNFATDGKNGFPNFLVHTRQVVAGTCVGVGASHFGAAEMAFDLVIVDEAAKCNPTELAVPLQSAKKVILVGDHKQLRPFLSPGMAVEHKNIDAEKNSARPFKPADLVISDFERLFSSNARKHVGCSLHWQYRMLPPIGRLVSSVFYEPDGLKLEHKRTDPDMPEDVCPKIIRKPITWLDTSYLGEQGHDTKVGKSTSPMNPAESDAIIELLKVLDNHKGFLKWLTMKYKLGEYPIGVISGYTSQIDSIDRKLEQSTISQDLRSRIMTGTVDSYQGKENLIVIYSLVKNNKGKGNFIDQGFLSRPNRMNVALSRARDKLIIVGSIKRWDPETRLGQVSAQVEVAARAKEQARECTASIWQEIQKVKESK